MKKSFFVYDTSKAFSIFMKYNFENSVEIKSCGYKKKFCIDNPELYDAFFFIINSVEDFILLKKSCGRLRNIFVSTPIKMLEFKISHIADQDLIMFDYAQTKVEVLREINSTLIDKKIL